MREKQLINIFGNDLKVLGLEAKNEKKVNKELLKPHGAPNP